MNYEYKVVETKNSKEAEKTMNLYAKSGWRVIQTTYYNNFKVFLIITFEREVL